MTTEDENALLQNISNYLPTGVA